MINHKNLDWSQQLRLAGSTLKKRAEIEKDCLNEAYNKAEQIRIGGEKIGLFTPGNRRLQLFKTGSPLEVSRLLAAFTAKTTWDRVFPGFHLVLLEDMPFATKGTALTNGIIEVPERGILLEATTEKGETNV